MADDRTYSILDESSKRRVRILQGIRDREINQALFNDDLRRDLEAEAASDPLQSLITPEMLSMIRIVSDAEAHQPHLRLFSNTDDVIIVPGFLGSELVDSTGGNGLIWIDPSLIWNSRKLSALKLDSTDRDAVSNVHIQPHGTIPLVYSLLKICLEFGRYRVDIFGFDWRKSIQTSAEDLANLIRSRNGQRIRPLHLIAHSQGSLVVRRALQLLGSNLARQLVNHLILIGPVTGGTFRAALGLTGGVNLPAAIGRFGIELPDDFNSVVQSMTGLYQLLPWRKDPIERVSPEDGAIRWLRDNKDFFRSKEFLQTGAQESRISTNFAWASRIDTSFFNDRTSIILGDRNSTTGGVKFDGGRLVPDERFDTTGDGMIPDSLAILPGVPRIYKMRDAEHLQLPAKWSVICAVQKLLAGDTPALEETVEHLAPNGSIAFRYLAKLKLPSEGSGPTDGDDGLIPENGRGKRSCNPGMTPRIATGQLINLGEIPPPQERRLRVFSFDPLLGNDLDSLDIDQITLRLPWEWADGNQLSPGPVGEYVEVVDYDPANNCFYPPVDLNHPHLLAQDGLTPTEGDPRFHQQMVYAVAMNTIAQFEFALGRQALWAPHLERDAMGEVISSHRPEDEFVRRLRIYPHAMQQANAYYHPDRKALLFGYFRAVKKSGMKNLPGGLVFTCLSYDIVAHETTHALLDGVHRYFSVPSNQDVFAFHEGFADVVAMFQHFSHPEVLRHVIERTRGDITKESEVAVMASQFGDALGHRGALREYLGRRSRDERGELVLDEQGRPKWEAVFPDPSALDHLTEAHNRGAVFVAALFLAFTNIYDRRVADLRRIAGVDVDADLTPDLVARMAEEAAKAAKHMMTMCIRAIDYLPPVDVTFGEYLRALITADYDLIKNDTRQYRAAVISAFRDWGIFPSDVQTLAVDSLIWKAPEKDALQRLKRFFDAETCSCKAFDGDRLQNYIHMKEYSKNFHAWLVDRFQKEPEHSDQEFGLGLGTETPYSIDRDKTGRPIFAVHSLRPCHRIGPRGEERLDFVVELVQRRKAFFDVKKQKAVDSGALHYRDVLPDFYFRGGCTLIIDPTTGEIRYCIRKKILDDNRLDRERQFRQLASNTDTSIHLSGGHDDPNPFGEIHRSCGS